MLSQVGSFKYLESMMYEDGKCDTDLKMIIGKAKASFGKLRKLLKNQGFRIETKMRMLKAYVSPVYITVWMRKVDHQ